MYSTTNAKIVPLQPSPLSESKPSSCAVEFVTSGTPAVDLFSRQPAPRAASLAPVAPGLALPAPVSFNHAPASPRALSAANPPVESDASTEIPLDLSEFYEIFASDEAAMGSIHVINNRSGRPKTIMPRPHSLYDEVDEAIAAIMDGFRDLYPEVVGDLPNPRSVIMEDSTANAFVFNHTLNSGGKVPYYIVVNTGSMTPELGRSALLGVMAHELTHLFFRHSRQEVREKLEKYYVVSGDKEPLGFMQENNPTVAKIVKAYVEAARAGDRRRVHFIKRKFPLEKFRWYGPEEHADDTSVRIMHSLGEDPVAIGKFNLHWLSAEEREVCKARIEDGEPVSYGDLTNTHHTDCWRYKHALDLSKTLP